MSDPPMPYTLRLSNVSLLISHAPTVRQINSPGERCLVSRRPARGIDGNRTSIQAGGLDDAGGSAAGSTARRSAAESVAVAGTRVDRHQEGPEPAGVEGPGPGRRDQDAARSRGSGLERDPTHPTTATKPAVARPIRLPR